MKFLVMHFHGSFYLGSVRHNGDTSCWIYHFVGYVNFYIMAGYTSYSIIQRTNICYKHKTIYYEPEMYKIYECFAVLQVL